MSEPSPSDSLIVSEEHGNLRLDKFLSLQYPKYSRTYFQYLIEEGFVLVNNERLKKKDKPKAGDEIEICFQITPEISLEPEDIPLDILYEDEFILAINKPSDFVVHPAPGHYSHTFVNALLYHCKTLPLGDSLRPGIVHRLDKDTSGVLLAAKTKEAHQRLISLFCQREIRKTYLTICVGNPGNITINEPIGRHALKRKEMTVSKDGRAAVSHFKVLKTEERLSFVEVQIETGRTHQIRVHLKHVHTPVLGDSVYGSEPANHRFKAARQMLHAHSVEFTHPFTGAPLVITAPLMQDMQKLLQTFFPD